MNRHYYFFFDMLSGVAFLFRAFTDRPMGLRSTSSPSVLSATGPNLSFRLMTGLSRELCSEFLSD